MLDELTTANHVTPGLLRGFKLYPDGLFDLGNFGIDKRGIRISFGVVLDEDGSRLVAPVLADQEASSRHRPFRQVC